MSEQFIGEIRIFPYNRIPRGWMPCMGQLLPIQSNTALFSLLGVQYGGDGRNNFAVPNLNGRVPLHTAKPQGGMGGGEETHTISIAEMPGHTHQAVAASDVTTTDPNGAVWGTPAIDAYGPYASATMNVNALDQNGSSAPHPNMQPYLALYYCISLEGIYPSRQ